MSGSTSSLFAALARLSLLVTLVAAPWPFGGYPLAWQPLIFAGILASLGCWWVSVLTRPVSHPDGGTILVDSLLPPVLLILLGALQLIPFANVPDVPAHAVLADAARAEIEVSTIPVPTPISVAPSMTRVTAARILFGVCAAFLGIQLFRDAGTRLWLYVPIAINAAAVAAFGIWQGAHWEEWKGMLFSTVPLDNAGNPFGPYVNRNNAAGLMNLGAAAAAAWAFLAAAPKVGHSFRRVSDETAAGARSAPHGDGGRAGVILPVVLLIAICAGVAASVSRGGILALGFGIIAAILVLLRSRRSRMVVSVVFVVLPLIALAIGWFGFGKEIRKRFSVLTSYTYQDSRLQHWSETMGAVQDAPLLGQGLGAYRYIHRPYQQSDNDRWYVNADNQFFELLVENGVVGLTLVLAMLGLLLVDARRLLLSRAPWEQRDTALLGAVLIASQSAQGLTDFGITLPANMLTAATLAGVVAGTAARALPFSLVPNISSPMVFRPRAAIPIGLILLAAAGLAWREVSLAAAAAVVTDSIGPLDRPDAVNSDSLDALVDRVQAAAEKRPDDAELQRTLGNLLTFRFRTSVLAALKADPTVTGRPEAELWSQTGLEPLFSESLRLDEASRARLRETLLQVDTTQSLTAAKTAFESALAGCRWVAAAAQRDAMTQVLVDDDTNSARRSVALAAVGAPSDGQRLVLLGVMARELGAEELALAIWKQAGLVAPERLTQIMASGGDWLRQPERLSAVLPTDIDYLLAFAESQDGADVALPIAQHVETLLETAGPEVVVKGQLGRVLQIRGDHAAALANYEIAVRENPLAWHWRVKAAEAKFALGRRDEALRDLEVAAKEFPRQSAIRAKLIDLERQALPTAP